MRLRISGVVAEYDPFHKGHEYHLAETRRGCDGVIVVMSGWYTQRGGAACLSKYDRAKMALLSGADAVFELPALYAVRPAEKFARGAVELLANLGCDALSFGTETDDLALLRRLSELKEEPPAFSHALHAELALGAPYPKAWAAAAKKEASLPDDLLSSPNAVLAAEYLRANNGRMEPYPVKRLGDHHGKTDSGFLSASRIRALFEEGKREEALSAIPCPLRAIAENALNRTDADDALLYRIRSMTAEEIAAHPDAGEGMENRVLRAAETAATRRELAESVKCRRYTRARIDRLLTQCFIGLTAPLANEWETPPYARLIGFRRDREDVLRTLSVRTKLPIVTRAREIEDHPVFRLECRAADAWALTRTEPFSRRAGREYTEKLIVI